MRRLLKPADDQHADRRGDVGDGAQFARWHAVAEKMIQATVIRTLDEVGDTRFEIVPYLGLDVLDAFGDLLVAAVVDQIVGVDVEPPAQRGVVDVGETEDVADDALADGFEDLEGGIGRTPSAGSSRCSALRSRGFRSRSIP